MDFFKLADDLINKKICVIKKANDVSIDHQGEIISELYRIVSRDDSFFSLFKSEEVNHKNLDNNFFNEGFYSSYFKSRIHIDLPDSCSNNEISYIISMCMKKFECKEGNGNTYFLNMSNLLGSLHAFFSYISDIKISFIHDNNTYISPIIFTHPYAGHDVFFWPTYEVEYESGNKNIFLEIKNIVEQYRSNYSNWYEHKWDEDDLVIFDNTCMLHAFTPGWDRNQRIFNQAICGTITPSYLIGNEDLWKDWNFKK